MYSFSVRGPAEWYETKKCSVVVLRVSVLSFVSGTLVTSGSKYFLPVLRPAGSWSFEALGKGKANFSRPHAGCYVLSRFTLDLGEDFKNLGPRYPGSMPFKGRIANQTQTTREANLKRGLGDMRIGLVTLQTTGILLSGHFPSSKHVRGREREGRKKSSE